MAKELFIPKLGQTVEEVTLRHWLVADGALVEEGDAVLEVETDKANFTVEATARGHFHRGPFQEGAAVPVLTVVALIGAPDETFQCAPAAQEKPAQSKAQPEASATRQEAENADRERHLFASPRARRLAASRQVNLAQVTPTGYGGERVAERDVMAYLNRAAQPTPLAEPLPVASLPAKVLERIPLQGVRGIIAARMGTSVHTTARVTLFMEADATRLVELRNSLKARVEKEWSFAPGYNDLLAKVVAGALRQFRYMNARLASDAVEHIAQINLGLAVDTDRGLLVPVIRDADKKSLREIATEFRELVERARTGKSLPSDLCDGTFTITNLGMYDVLAFTPIINLPEAAILGIGAITPQPTVRNGEIQIREMLILSLVFDHRLVDGAPAARFMQFLKQLIEEPMHLLAL